MSTGLGVIWWALAILFALITVHMSLAVESEDVELDEHVLILSLLVVVFGVQWFALSTVAIEQSPIDNAIIYENNDGSAEACQLHLKSGEIREGSCSLGPGSVVLSAISGVVLYAASWRAACATDRLRTQLGEVAEQDSVEELEEESGQVLVYHKRGRR